jgi:hypothetical protein
MPRKHRRPDYRIARLHRAIYETLEAVTEAKRTRDPIRYLRIGAILIFVGGAVIAVSRSNVEVVILTLCAASLLFNNRVMSLVVRLSLIDTNALRQGAGKLQSATSALCRGVLVLRDSDVRSLPEEDLEGLRKLLDLSAQRDTRIEARLTIAILGIMPERADSRDLPLIEALATRDYHRKETMLVRTAASSAHSQLCERLQDVAETNRLLRASSGVPSEKLLRPAGATEANEKLLLRSANGSSDPK